MWPFKKQNLSDPTKGELGYFGLVNWWLTEFSQDERRHIESTYRPMGLPPESRPLTQGDILYSTGNAVGLLNGMASWFRKPEDRLLARRILLKAETIAKNVSVLDRHLTYHGLIENYYRDRDADSNAFDAAINYCYKQIALAPNTRKDWRRQFPKRPLPQHTGYRQLAIILSKQGKYEEAVSLSIAAKRQGWAGDWDERIARYRAQLAKSKGHSDRSADETS